MADKFRIGQVGRALSSGLGLFAEKKMKEEKERIERQWQMTMQNIADARAQARNDQEFQRQLALNAQRDATARERDATNRDFTASENKLNRDARAGEFETLESRRQQERHDDIVTSRHEALLQTLDKIEEKYQKQRENPAFSLNPEKMSQLELDYKNERDQTIGAFGQSMMMRAQEYPEAEAYMPFRANGRDEIASVMEQLGASYEGASKIADRFMKYMSDPGADTAGAGGGGWKPDGRVDATGESMTSLHTGGGNYRRPSGGPAAAAPPPSNAGAAAPTASPARVDPNPQTPMAPQASPGSLSQLFNTEPVKNPDGTPKYPMNRESMGYKLFDWMKQPVPYGE